MSVEARSATSSIDLTHRSTPILADVEDEDTVQKLECRLTSRNSKTRPIFVQVEHVIRAKSKPSTLERRRFGATFVSSNKKSDKAETVKKNVDVDVVKEVDNDDDPRLLSGSDNWSYYHRNPTSTQQVQQREFNGDNPYRIEESKFDEDHCLRPLPITCANVVDEDSEEYQITCCGWKRVRKNVDQQQHQHQHHQEETPVQEVDSAIMFDNFDIVEPSCYLEEIDNVDKSSAGSYWPPEMPPEPDHLPDCYCIKHDDRCATINNEDNWPKHCVSKPEWMSSVNVDNCYCHSSRQNIPLPEFEPEVEVDRGPLSVEIVPKCKSSPIAVVEEIPPEEIIQPIAINLENCKCKMPSEEKVVSSTPKTARIIDVERISLTRAAGSTSRTPSGRVSLEYIPPPTPPQKKFTSSLPSPSSVEEFPCATCPKLEGLIRISSSEASTPKKQKPDKSNSVKSEPIRQTPPESPKEDRIRFLESPRITTPSEKHRRSSTPSPSICSVSSSNANPATPEWVSYVRDEYLTKGLCDGCELQRCRINPSPQTYKEDVCSPPPVCHCKRSTPPPVCPCKRSTPPRFSKSPSPVEYFEDVFTSPRISVPSCKGMKMVPKRRLVDVVVPCPQQVPACKVDEVPQCPEEVSKCKDDKVAECPVEISPCVDNIVPPCPPEILQSPNDVKPVVNKRVSTPMPNPVHVEVIKGSHGIQSNSGNTALGTEMSTSTYVIVLPTRRELDNARAEPMSLSTNTVVTQTSLEFGGMSQKRDISVSTNTEVLPKNREIDNPLRHETGMSTSASATPSSSEFYSKTPITETPTFTTTTPTPTSGEFEIASLTYDSPMPTDAVVRPINHEFDNDDLNRNITSKRESRDVDETELFRRFFWQQVDVPPSEPITPPSEKLTPTKDMHIEKSIICQKSGKLFLCDGQPNSSNELSPNSTPKGPDFSRQSPKPTARLHICPEQDTQRTIDMTLPGDNFDCEHQNVCNSYEQYSTNEIQEDIIRSHCCNFVNQLSNFAPTDQKRMSPNYLQPYQLRTEDESTSYPFQEVSKSPFDSSRRKSVCFPFEDVPSLPSRSDSIYSSSNQFILDNDFSPFRQSFPNTGTISEDLESEESQCHGRFDQREVQSSPISLTNIYLRHVMHPNEVLSAGSNHSSCKHFVQETSPCNSTDVPCRQCRNVTKSPSEKSTKSFCGCAFQTAVTSTDVPCRQCEGQQSKSPSEKSFASSCGCGLTPKTQLTNSSCLPCQQRELKSPSEKSTVSSSFGNDFQTSTTELTLLSSGEGRQETKSPFHILKPTPGRDKMSTIFEEKEQFTPQCRQIIDDTHPSNAGQKLRCVCSSCSIGKPPLNYINTCTAQLSTNRHVTMPMPVDPCDVTLLSKHLTAQVPDGSTTKCDSPRLSPGQVIQCQNMSTCSFNRQRNMSSYSNDEDNESLHRHTHVRTCPTPVQQQTCTPTCNSNLGERQLTHESTNSFDQCHQQQLRISGQLTPNPHAPCFAKCCKDGDDVSQESLPPQQTCPYSTFTKNLQMSTSPCSTSSRQLQPSEDVISTCKSHCAPKITIRCCSGHSKKSKIKLDVELKTQETQTDVPSISLHTAQSFYNLPNIPSSKTYVTVSTNTIDIDDLFDYYLQRQCAMPWNKPCSCNCPKFCEKLLSEDKVSCRSSSLSVKNKQKIIEPRCKKIARQSVLSCCPSETKLDCRQIESTLPSATKLDRRSPAKSEASCGRQKPRIYHENCSVAGTRSYSSTSRQAPFKPRPVNPRRWLYPPPPPFLQTSPYYPNPMAYYPIAYPMAMNNQPPMVNPYSQRPMANPYNQRPMADPYGQRPMADPYGQRPMADPYSQRPIANLFNQSPLANPYNQHPMASPYSQNPIPNPYPWDINDFAEETNFWEEELSNYDENFDDMRSFSACDDVYRSRRPPRMSDDPPRNIVENEEQFHGCFHPVNDNPFDDAGISDDSGCVTPTPDSCFSPEILTVCPQGYQTPQNRIPTRIYRCEKPQDDERRDDNHNFNLSPINLDQQDVQPNCACSIEGTVDDVEEGSHQGPGITPGDLRCQYFVPFQPHNVSTSHSLPIDAQQEPEPCTADSCKFQAPFKKTTKDTNGRLSTFFSPPPTLINGAENGDFVRADSSMSEPVFEQISEVSGCGWYGNSTTRRPGNRYYTYRDKTSNVQFQEPRQRHSAPQTPPLPKINNSDVDQNPDVHYTCSVIGLQSTAANIGDQFPVICVPEPTARGNLATRTPYKLLIPQKSRQVPTGNDCWTVPLSPTRMLMVCQPRDQQASPSGSSQLKRQSFVHSCPGGQMMSFDK